MTSQKRTSGYDREHLRRLKYASVESKFHALDEMNRLAKEAQESCRKRGARFHPVLPETTLGNDAPAPM